MVLTCIVLYADEAEAVKMPTRMAERWDARLSRVFNTGVAACLH
jgi:hypothetical protein